MDKKDNLDLIPKGKVVDDMYGESFIRYSARDYYYINYATDKEKKEIDKEIKNESMMANCVLIIMIIGLILIFLWG